MITKIRKYLLKNPEISFFKKNNSGSEYYNIGTCKIRISNHIPTRVPNTPGTLNIVVINKTEANAFLGGTVPMAGHTYEDMKRHIDYYVQNHQIFKNIFTTYLEAEKKKIANMAKIQAEKEVEEPINKQVGELNYNQDKRTFVFLGMSYYLPNMSKKNWEVLINTLKGENKPVTIEELKALVKSLK